MTEPTDPTTTRLREIRERRENSREDVCFLLDLISTQEGKIEAARVAIEAAPHGDGCQSKVRGYYPGAIGFRQSGFPYPCDCWKAEALATFGGKPGE